MMFLCSFRGHDGWIGLTDPFQDDEYKWDDGNHATWTAWKDGDLSKSVHSGLNNCVKLKKDGKGWEAKGCGEDKHSLCQYTHGNSFFFHFPLFLYHDGLFFN